MPNDQPKRPKPARSFERRMVRASDLQADIEGPVTLNEREGVYVHSFKCRRCQLEFMLFSWQADRHTVANVRCPECGATGRFVHYRAILTENVKPDIQGPAEIFRHWPHKGSELMDDTVV